MAFPNLTVSTDPQVAAIIGGKGLVETTQVSYETGGVALADPSQGFEVQIWQAELQGNGDVVMSVPSNPAIVPTVVANLPTALSISLAFDQSMRASLAYSTAAGTLLYWFDSTIAAFTHLDLSASVSKALITLDTKTLKTIPESDIVLVYLRDGTLYYRHQRDRFLAEITLRTGLESTQIEQFGMGENRRMQIVLK